MRLGGTLISIASLYWDIPRGARNSSRRISPGCSGGIPLGMAPLVIVDDFYVVGVRPLPHEANAKPIVHAYAELTCAFSFEFFEPIAGRYSQVSKTFRGIQHQQLAKQDAPKRVRKPSNAVAVKHFLSVGVSEAFDQSIITRRVNSGK